jgi:hypothetical protein
MGESTRTLRRSTSATLQRSDSRAVMTEAIPLGTDIKDVGLVAQFRSPPGSLVYVPGLTAQRILISSELRRAHVEVLEPRRRYSSAPMSPLSRSIRSTPSCTASSRAPR